MWFILNSDLFVCYIVKEIRMSTMNNSDAEKLKSESALTLDDLMLSESAVLRRINDDFKRDEGSTMASHYSSTGGHNSSGTHSSHTSAIDENVMKLIQAK